MYIIIFLIVVAVVFGVVGILKGMEYGFVDSDCWFLFLTIAVIIPAFLIIALCFYIPKEIDTFIAQKAYIENHIAKSEIEDAALANKKIELNDWLFDIQWSVKNRKGWTFYPEKVLDLEPIQ